LLYFTATWLALEVVQSEVEAMGQLIDQVGACHACWPGVRRPDLRVIIGASWMFINWLRLPGACFDADPGIAWIPGPGG